MDPRVKLPRKKLKDALVSLTLEQGYERISIQAAAVEPRPGWLQDNPAYQPEPV